MSEVLSKALKLKTAAIRGDEHVREFALKKYREYLIDHALTEMDVNAFETDQTVIKNRKSFTIQGKTFYTMAEFRQWYDPLNIYQKLKVLAEVGRSSDFKNLK